MKSATGNRIKTVCGKNFVLSFLNQVALGIYGTEENTGKSGFIPNTYALYQIAGQYILEVTVYESERNELLTSYQLLSECEAGRFLASDKTRSVV